jgi:hypothetical protein
MTVQRTGRAIPSDLNPARKSQRALCTGRRLPTLPISVAGPAVNGGKENPASQTNNSAWVTKPSSTSGPTSGSFHTEKSFARFVRNIILWVFPHDFDWPFENTSCELRARRFARLTPSICRFYPPDTCRVNTVSIERVHCSVDPRF